MRLRDRPWLEAWARENGGRWLWAWTQRGHARVVVGVFGLVLIDVTALGARAEATAFGRARRRVEAFYALG